MKQHPKSVRTSPHASAVRSGVPSLRIVGSATRFVGLEAIPPGSNLSDLCTYECEACGHTQASTVPRTGNAKGSATGFKPLGFAAARSAGIFPADVGG